MALRTSSWLAASLFLFHCPFRAQAEKLQITSKPPGAAVEIDGVAVGTTPFAKDYPGGYFHKTRTALGSRLEHVMVARITLKGYATKELLLSDGPAPWFSLNGRNHGEYWVFKAAHFHVNLDPIPEVFTGTISARVARNTAVDFVRELSLQEMVAQTKPGVVFLKSLQKSGTGFLITDTGVIATNAHLVRGEQSLLALLPGGVQFDAKVEYIDEDLDIALLKIEGSQFPHLTLADASTVQQGDAVFAIGNPGDAMLYSMTSGIVSAVGKFPSAGSGTWIQTNAQINPGNSGGPLVNSRGEVIGITTLKLVKKDTSGIGFALSVTDLLDVLRRFYPRETVIAEKLSTPVVPPSAPIAPVPKTEVGTVEISEPRGAEIRVESDEAGKYKVVGYVPAILNLPAGPHKIILRHPPQVDWFYDIIVMKDSRVSLGRPLGISAPALN
jgi:S1-C subfamily serine protease